LPSMVPGRLGLDLEGYTAFTYFHTF
jgi:hypothetical protein